MRVWVVQRVWRWPLKRRGFSLHGGVTSLQRSARVMLELVVAVFVSIVPLLFFSGIEMGAEEW